MPIKSTTSITEGQIAKIMEANNTALREALAEIDLSKVDAQKFLVERIGDLKTALIPPIVRAIRSLIIKFNPAEFIGKGWSIDPTDEQLPAAPTKIDPAMVVFKNMHRPGEEFLKGEERHRRHREEGNRCLTDDHFLNFWNNKDKIPESWKKTETGEMRIILFDATKLRNPSGLRCVLCLYFRGGAWDWDCSWVEDDCGAQYQSAVAGE